MSAHFLGLHKDKRERLRGHYEARLALARNALSRFSDAGDHWTYGSAPDQQDYDRLLAACAEPFGEAFAKEAAESVGGDGESYRAVYLRMKAHIADLERKVGVPPRLS